MKTLKGVIAATTYVDYQAPLRDSNLFIHPLYFLLSSGLYAIEFEDSLAPSAAEPGAHEIPVPNGNDAMGVSMVAPSVFRRNAVRYLTYDNAEPEAIGVTILAPSVLRIQQAIPVYYEYATEPESLAVAMLPPAVSRRNHPVYIIPEESLAIAMLAPTVTRTNT